MAKKYELYELQPQADNFVKDVNDVDAAVEAAKEYFTNKFKNLMVDNTIKHQVVAVNNQVQIEIACLAKGFIILDTFELRKGNPFRDIFVSKGFHLEIIP
ncbi:hypothetical protein [Intestinibacter sp.]|uniref:hypothetical protein n=1 Tax=Intestinibacter sp. TaxID=1965304 RepID=UPI003F18E5DC